MIINKLRIRYLDLEKELKLKTLFLMMLTPRQSNWSPPSRPSTRSRRSATSAEAALLSFTTLMGSTNQLN